MLALIPEYFFQIDYQVRKQAHRNLIGPGVNAGFPYSRWAFN